MTARSLVKLGFLLRRDAMLMVRAFYPQSVRLSLTVMATRWTQGEQAVPCARSGERGVA